MTGSLPPGDAVDAHLHVIDPTRFAYPWLADVPRIDAVHLPSDIATSRSPRFVHVQAGTVPEHGLAEARWIQELADGDYPEIAGIVAFAPLERGAAVAGELAALRELPRMRGVRRLLQDEDDLFLAAPAFREGLAEVRRAGLTFDACIRWWQLPALADLLAAEPDLPVVLDHLGKPPITEPFDGENGRAWLAGIRRLAELPRVHVKLSGLPAEATDPFAGASSLGPWLRAAADAFGADRCMTGSDWPVSRDGALGLGYDAWLDVVVSELSPSEAERERLLTGTATAFYGLP